MQAVKNFLSSHLEKLTLIGPFLLVALVIYSLVQTSHEYADLGNAKVNIEASHLSNELLHELQKERGMTAGFLGSNGSRFSAELKAQRRLVDKAYREFEEYVSTLDSNFIQTALVNPLSAQMQQLASTRGQIDSLQLPLSNALSFYTGMNAKVIAYNGAVVNTTRVSFIQQKLAVLYSIAQAKEYSGIERAILSNAFGAGAFNNDLYQRWLANSAKQQAFLQTADEIASNDFKTVLRDFNNSTSVRAVEGYRKYAQAQGLDPLDRDPQEWFKASTSRINELKSVQQNLFTEIDDGIAQKRTSSVIAVILNSVLCIFVILLSIGIYAVIRDRRRQSDALKQVIEQLDSHNDLSMRIQEITKDDLGEIAKLLNKTLDKLNKDFTDIKSMTESINISSENTAVATKQTDSNIKQQLSSVKATTLSIEQVNKAIEEDLDNIQNVSNTTTEFRVISQQGTEKVQNAVNGIRSTASEVQEVGKIIEQLNAKMDDIQNMVEVISSVAEQTNLLALNAAIEAARAGEQGRGFAVVADEVRSLATTTRDSTHKISNIVEELTVNANQAVHSIQKSNDSALVSVDMAEEINTILISISDKMGDLDNLSAQVVSSAQSQKDAINQITIEIRNIDHTSQENASGVSTVAQAATDVTGLVEKMHNKVSEYKL